MHMYFTVSVKCGVDLPVQYYRGMCLRNRYSLGLGTWTVMGAGTEFILYPRVQKQDPEKSRACQQDLIFFGGGYRQVQDFGLCDTPIPHCFRGHLNSPVNSGFVSV